MDSRVVPGDPLTFESRDTTHYSVADAEGNVVSNTFTLGSSFGAHVMAPGTGTMHIILAVTDHGSPRLTRYRRVIVEVAK